MSILWLPECQDPITRKEDGLQEDTLKDSDQEDLQDGTNLQGNLFSKMTETINQGQSHLTRKTFPQKNIHLHILLGVIIEDHHQQKEEEMRIDPINIKDQIEVTLPEDSQGHHLIPDTLPEGGRLAEIRDHQAGMAETIADSLNHLDRKDKEEDFKEVLQETDSAEKNLQFLTIKTRKKLSIPNLITKCFVTNVPLQATNLKIALGTQKVGWRNIVIIVYNMIGNFFTRKNFVDLRRVFIGPPAIQKTIKGAN